MVYRKQPGKRTRCRHNWPEIIKKWQTSGISQTEYCRKNNLDLSSFSKWKKKISNKPEAPAEESFVEIPRPRQTGLPTLSPQPLLINNDPLNNAYEIILPENIRIRIGNNFNPLILKNIIKTIQEL